MAFSSLLFIYAFLPLSIGVYYLTPVRFRNCALLIISAVFCGMCSLNFFVFILIYVLCNYVIGLAVGALNRYKALSVIPLAIGMLADLSVFLFFKGNFFERLNLPLAVFPVGVSFFTLSSIGYLIDVFRGKIGAERNPLNFALFIMFFPKLPMGPLIEYANFYGMIKKRSGGLSEIGAGLSVFIKGLAKKVIFADNLYLLYSAVHSMDVGSISSLSAWLGVISYMLYLYFALSGLSDMGAGLARCFGFRLPRSFNYPLFSMGINDFCSKWHITPVRWFRQYMISPLTVKGTNRAVGYILLIASWGVLGLWYDISANKLIWGLLIGVAAVIEKSVSKQKTLKATAIAYTFIVTSFCWIFFFGDSLSYSFRYFLAIIGGNNNIADSVSLYLLKSYIVVLLAGAYFSTDLFKNLVIRSKRKALKRTVDIISPFFILTLLVFCTSLISYSGESEMLLLKL